MKKSFKKVPALEKGLRILKLVASSEIPLSLTDIAKSIGYNLSTIYNIAYTFVDLGYLENHSDKKFSLGRKFYELSSLADNDPELINLVHPYMEQINEKTKVSVFFGIRSGLYTIVVDKVESAFNLKLTLDTGSRMPLLAGAAGRVLISQLPDNEIDKLLLENKLEKYTQYSCVDKKEFKDKILMDRKEGIAISNEEFTEGVCSFAVPLNVLPKKFIAAIWIIGLKNQIQKRDHTFYAKFLKKTAKEIEKQIKDVYGQGKIGVN